MTRRTTALTGAIIAVTFAGAADAQSMRARSGDIEVHAGLVPAATIASHASPVEQQMHGGVPKGKDQQHLVVSLFDGGARVADAQIVATVYELGLGSVRKRLDPMPVAGVASWGNYFRIQDPAHSRVELVIVRPGSSAPLTMKLEPRLRR